MIRLAIPLMMVTFFASCSFAQRKRPTTEVEDKTGKVFDGIAELVFLRDSVRPRYAFVATGELHQTAVGMQPRLNALYWLAAIDEKKKFAYHANCTIKLADLRGAIRDSQRWAEKCKCGKQFFADGGFINSSHVYRSPNPGESSREFLNRLHLEVEHLDPFDDIFTAATNMMSYTESRRVAEQTFLERSKLVSSKLDGFGNAVSSWDSDQPSMRWKIRMVQSKLHDFLPVEIEIKGVEGFYKDFFSHTRVKWEKQKDKYLPMRIEAACTTYQNGKPIINQWFIKLDWLVGDDVPEEFFQCQSDDYREPIRQHFNLSFDRNIQGVGVIKAEPWQAPEELSEPWPVYLHQKKEKSKR